MAEPGERSFYEGCANRGGVCDCAGRPCAVAPSQGEPEPLGHCIIHGDYWTDDCYRCYPVAPETGERS